MSFFLAFLALTSLAWWGYLFSGVYRREKKFFYHAASGPETLCGLFAGDRAPRQRQADPEPWPAVTVIVPGRNEAHMLPETLGSLLAMDYPAYRVVFVDDQSSDATPEVCRRLQGQFPHLKVIVNTTSPPDGWVGKLWAIHQARQEIQTPWVLFTDSDLKFHPQCLRQMMRLAHQRQADLVSLLPYLENQTWGERLVLLAGILLLGLAYPISCCNQPGYPGALTAGGFLLFRTSTYQAIGGHESLRGQMIEDIALGQSTKRKGFHVFAAFTHDLMGGRMYEGLADAWRGLKKNAYAGARFSPWRLVLYSLGILLMGVLVPFYPLFFLGNLGWGMALSLLAVVGMVLGTRRLTRMHRFGAGIFLLTPVALGLFVLILWASAWEHYFGGNVWSGRRYRRASLETLT